VGQSVAEDAEPVSRGRRAFLANNALTREIRLTLKRYWLAKIEDVYVTPWLGWEEVE
jgi:hypothetical protein